MTFALISPVLPVVRPLPSSSKARSDRTTGDLSHSSLWTRIAFFAASAAICILGWKTLPLVGEEPRRGEVAREMVRHNDWLVPREQGIPYCTRPPLQNWAIAVTGIATGRFDAFAVRLPSLLATGMTALLCYLVAKMAVGEVAAISAGVAFLTMGQTLTIGQLGETDPLFAALLGGALLLWYAGYARGSGRTTLWGLAGMLTGLAALTKGLQAPVYFLVCSTGFLIFVGQGTLVFSRAFGLAITAMLLPILGWTIPYYFTAGPEATVEIWCGQVEQRLTTHGLLSHLIGYPVATFTGMLPWSLLFLGLFERSIRRRLIPQMRLIQYLLLSLGLTFLSLWVIPEAKTRYFLPLYPLGALLAGLVIDAGAREWRQGARRPPQDPHCLRVFFRLLQVMAGIAILALGLLLATRGGAAIGLGTAWLWPSSWGALLVALAGGMVIAAVRRVFRQTSPARITWGVLAVGVFLGLGHRLVILPAQQKLLSTPQAQIAGLAEKLSDPATLVSLGPVPAGFRFHYPSFVRQLPVDADPRGMGVSVFCLAGTQFQRKAPETKSFAGPSVQFEWGGRTIVCRKLGFPWKIIDVIPLGRTPTRDPQPVVVIGRVCVSQSGEPVGARSP